MNGILASTLCYPYGSVLYDQERERVKEQRIDCAIKQAVYYRNYRRARERALTALAQQYPDDYKQLLEREKARDEEEGRKWLDINGTTSGVDTRSATTFTYTGETSNQSTNESYNGGEA